MKKMIKIGENCLQVFNSDAHDYAIMYYDRAYGTVWTETDTTNYYNHQVGVYVIAYHGRKNRNHITRKEIYRRIDAGEYYPCWKE